MMDCSGRGRQRVRVTSWVVVEEKKHLHYSLVGFLKGGGEGFMKIEGWLEKI